MSTPKTTETRTLNQLVRLVDSLERSASQTQDDHVKRILLKAGCDLADLALRTVEGRRAA